MLAVVLSSCSSTDPYSFHYNELTDQTRVLRHTAGDSTVVVRREPDGISVAAAHFFTLDGEKIVRLDQEEQYTFHIPAGQYVIGSLCKLPFSDITNEASLNAQPGKTYIYRDFSVVGAGCSIAPMSR